MRPRESKAHGEPPPHHGQAGLARPACPGSSAPARVLTSSGEASPWRGGRRPSQAGLPIGRGQRH